MIQIIDTSSKYIEGKREISPKVLRIIDCSCQYLTAQTQKTASNFEYYSIFCILSGQLLLGKQLLSKNDCFLISRFSNTAFSVKEDAEIIKIVFYHTDFSSILKSNKPVFFSRIPEIYRQVKAIYRLSLFKNNLPGTAEGMLLSLLNDIKNNINAAPSEVALYKNACEWIEKNSKKAITAEEVATASGCSREHLNRVIKAVSGETLSEIIANFRIMEIKRLCENQSLSLSHIAFELNFFSRELMCKFFKYHTKSSITEYRKNQSLRL